MSTSRDDVIPGLPERSILYVSATVHPDHPLHGVFRKHVDPKPDMDLGRVVESSGPWIRRYFAEEVIDGTTAESLPTDLSPYRGLVVGCSLHYMNPERGEIAPWQHRIMDLIRRAVDDYNLPFLGLCGGGQIGLTAFGGRVGPNPIGAGIEADQPGSLFVGASPLELTAEGSADPLFKGCPRSFGMLGIHSDYLTEFPPGFTVLANSPDIPNQVLAYGDKVRLLGLHPEMSATFVRGLTDVVIDTGGFGPYPKRILREVATRIVPTPEANYHVVRNFLSEFCADK